MKALTIDALWAWAILAGHKQVENRTWTTSFRGRLAIHAGKNASRDGDALRLFDRLDITPPSHEVLADLRGRILGTVELVDCVAYAAGAAPPPKDVADPQNGTVAADPFATGPWCWLLQDARWLPQPVEYAGQLGLWNWPSGDELLPDGHHPEGTAPACRPSSQSTPSSNLFST